MYILIEVCQNPGFLRILYFISIILDIIFTIVPIGLIVMLLIDFTKGLLKAEDYSSSKDVKNVIQRIVSAVLLFSLPWLINAFMSIMDNVGWKSEFTTCWNNAKSGNFAAYDAIYEKEQNEKEEERKAEIEKNAEEVKATINNNKYIKLVTVTGSSGNNMADELISIASKELGNTNNSGKYGQTGVPWCALFTTWALMNTEDNGVNLYKDVIQKEHKDPNRAGAACTMYLFKNSSNLEFHYSPYYSKKNFTNDYSYTPKKGDIIYFDWNGDWNGIINSTCGQGNTWIDHIGIVEYSENGKVHTIEGNSSGRVSKRDYDLNSKSIIGYGSWYK